MNEQELFMEFARTRDATLRNRIIEKYLPYAEITAKKFAGKGVEYEDLYQVACLALVKAVDRFAPDKDLKFVTFAVPTITGEIKNYFRDKYRTVRLPRRFAPLAAKVRETIDGFEKQGLPPPTVREIAKILGEKEEDVLQALEATATAVSLDAENEEGSPLHDMIAASGDDYAAIDDADQMRAALSTLTEPERELVKLRFQNGVTQTEIAKKWGVSQMFVSRMEKKTIQKLRIAFEND